MCRRQLKQKEAPVKGFSVSSSAEAEGGPSERVVYRRQLKQKEAPVKGFRRSAVLTEGWSLSGAAFRQGFYPINMTFQRDFPPHWLQNSMNHPINPPLIIGVKYRRH